MAGNASADLMAHWRFNEAAGDTVEDSSGNGNLSPRKTSSNGNTRFRIDEIYETLIELVEVSGLPKAFLAQQTGESAGNIDTTIKKLLH